MSLSFPSRLRLIPGCGKISSFPWSFVAAIALWLGCATLPAQTAAELIRQGSVRDGKLQAAQALELYLQAEKLEPRNGALLAKIARQYRHLMADTSNSAEKLRLAQQALDYSMRAAAASPNDSDAQLAIAISLGKMLPLVDNKEQVAFSRRIKASADRALQLNAKNDLAWFVLGRWHQGYAEMPAVRRKIGEMLYGKFPESTDADAAKCFEKAVAANPSRLMSKIELGRTYARMGKTAEARALIQQALAMPNVGKDDADAKQRGRETLAGLD